MYFGVFDFYLFLFLKILVIFVKSDFYKFLNLKKIFFLKKKRFFYIINIKIKYLIRKLIYNILLFTSENKKIYNSDRTCKNQKIYSYDVLQFLFRLK